MECHSSFFSLVRQSTTADCGSHPGSHPGSRLWVLLWILLWIPPAVPAPSRLLKLENMLISASGVLSSSKNSAECILSSTLLLPCGRPPDPT